MVTVKDHHWRKHIVELEDELFSRVQGLEHNEHEKCRPVFFAHCQLERAPLCPGVALTVSYLCGRTENLFPDSMQIVCILPGRERVRGQTRKSPKTSLSKLSWLRTDAGIVFWPGSDDGFCGSKTP